MSANYKYQGIALTDVVATSKPTAQGTINNDTTFTTLATFVQGSYNFNSNAYLVPSQYAYLSTGNIGYSYKGNLIQPLAKFEEYNTAGGQYNLTTTGYNNISGIIIGGGGGGAGGAGGLYTPSGANQTGESGGPGGAGSKTSFTALQVASVNTINITVGNGGPKSDGSNGRGGNYSPYNDGPGTSPGNKGNETTIIIGANSITAPGGNGGTGAGPNNTGTAGNARSAASGNTPAGTQTVNSPYTSIDVTAGGGGAGGAGNNGEQSSAAKTGGQGTAGQGGYALIFLQKN